MARLTKADVLKKAEDLKNWGKWGPDDELGVLNYVTPEDIVNAAKLVCGTPPNWCGRARSSGSVSISTRTGRSAAFSADAGTRCTRCWQRALMLWQASTT